jgi:hypothetical protein
MLNISRLRTTSQFGNIGYSFWNHPKNVCMTYWQHFYFSMELSGVFLKGFIKAFIHAILPDLYITSTTDSIKYIEQRLEEVGCRKLISIVN